MKEAMLFADTLGRIWLKQFVRFIRLYRVRVGNNMDGSFRSFQIIGQASTRS